MIERNLTLLKLDLGQRNAPGGYVVFGPEGDVPTPDNGHRPRPKVTLDADTWIQEGRPTTLRLQLIPVESNLQARLREEVSA